MGFPRQEYWRRFSFPSPGDLPDSGMEPVSLALAGGVYHWAIREALCIPHGSLNNYYLILVPVWVEMKSSIIVPFEMPSLLAWLCIIKNYPKLHPKYILFSADFSAPFSTPMSRLKTKSLYTTLFSPPCPHTVHLSPHPHTTLYLPFHLLIIT